MAKLTRFTGKGFSAALGLCGGDGSAPAAWGVARLIRREVLRRPVVTRRELRHMIEPYLLAASFDGEAKSVIQGVAERMVEAGELAELKLGNQRGYAPKPPRWVKLNDVEAVLLGATQCEVCEFTRSSPNQFLRRFCPTESIVAQLDRIGVVEQGFDDWLGPPAWKSFGESSQEIESVGQLLDWYINRLDTEGSPLRLESTRILAVQHRPGEFFGSERHPNNSRWVPCGRLSDGIYVAAQPAQHENHWSPLLIRIQGTAGKAIELHCRNDRAANADLRNWLLIALGEKNGQKEIIAIDSQANEVQGTFPLPSTMRKILGLIGEPTGKWQRYAVTSAVSKASLLRHCVPEIRVE